jgi:hypothetical protein
MTDDDGVDRARARSGVTAARERRTAGSWCGVQHRQDGTCSDTTTRQMADAATPCSPRDIVRSVPYRANDARAHRDTEGESTRQEHTTRVWYRLYRSSRSQVVRSYVSIHSDRVRKDPPWLSLAAPVPHYMEYGEHHRVGERWDGRPLSMPGTRHAGHIARNSLRNGGVANEWNRVQHARRRSA